MGLAIVKRLIELNHGQIGVESRLGEGSRFIVALPAASAALSAEIDDVYPLIGIG
jgi:signal transduction histidine kinase